MPSVRRIEIGSRLRDCRVRARLSQADAGADVGKSDKTISAYEAGERMPDVETLAHMCLLYGVSTDEIIFGTPMVPQVLRDVFGRVTGNAPDPGG